jgi:hypothetical protein
LGYFDTLKNLEGIRQRENQNALARQAGGMLAQGDQTGARNALWQGGELDAGFKIEEGMASSRKAKAEAMDKWTTGLGRMLQDPRYQGNPDAAWGDAVAFAGQLGIDPEALNRDKAAFDRNPEGWAQFWNGKAQEEIRVLQQGPYVRGVNTRTGATAWENNFPQDSQDRKLPQGYEIGPDGQPGIADWYVKGEQRKAGARRAPARGRGAGRPGGGSGYTGLPPGYRPK